MKKMSLLALVIAMVVALPGCGKRKDSVPQTRRDTIARYADTTGMEFEVDEEDEDEDGDEEEIDEEAFKNFSFDEDELGDLDNLELDEDDFMEEEDEFTWVDAQADDEFQKLYFSFNHYGVRADQKEALNYDIDQVKQLVAEAGNSAPTIVVEGHACQEGTPAYNLALSEKRAKNVADLFVAAGVDRNIIKVVGRGQECPATINGRVVNGSRQDREPNRRVEVRVIYT